MRHILRMINHQCWARIRILDDILASPALDPTQVPNRGSRRKDPAWPRGFVGFDSVCDLVDVDMFEYLFDGFRYVLGDWQDEGDGGLGDGQLGQDVGGSGVKFKKLEDSPEGADIASRSHP